MVRERERKSQRRRLFCRFSHSTHKSCSSTPIIVSYFINNINSEKKLRVISPRIKISEKRKVSHVYLLRFVCSPFRIQYKRYILTMVMYSAMKSPIGYYEIMAEREIKFGNSGETTTRRERDKFLSSSIPWYVIKRGRISKEQQQQPERASWRVCVFVRGCQI